MRYHKGDKVTTGMRPDNTSLLHITVSKDVTYLGLPDTEGTSMELYQAREAPRKEEYPWKGTHDPGHLSYIITKALGTKTLTKDPIGYRYSGLVMVQHLPLEAMPLLIGHWMPQVRDAAMARLAGRTRTT